MILPTSFISTHTCVHCPSLHREKKNWPPNTTEVRNRNAALLKSFANSQSSLLYFCECKLYCVKTYILRPGNLERNSFKTQGVIVFNVLMTSRVSSILF